MPATSSFATLRVLVESDIHEFAVGFVWGSVVMIPFAITFIFLFTWFIDKHFQLVPRIPDEGEVVTSEKPTVSEDCEDSESEDSESSSLCSYSSDGILNKYKSMIIAKKTKLACESLLAPDVKLGLSLEQIIGLKKLSDYCETKMKKYLRKTKKTDVGEEFERIHSLTRTEYAYPLTKESKERLLENVLTGKKDWIFQEVLKFERPTGEEGADAEIRE